MSAAHTQLTLASRNRHGCHG